MVIPVTIPVPVTVQRVVNVATSAPAVPRTVTPADQTATASGSQPAATVQVAFRPYVQSMPPPQNSHVPKRTPPAAPQVPAPPMPARPVGGAPQARAAVAPTTRSADQARLETQRQQAESAVRRAALDLEAAEDEVVIDPVTVDSAPSALMHTAASAVMEAAKAHAQAAVAHAQAQAQIQVPPRVEIIRVSQPPSTAGPSASSSNTVTVTGTKVISAEEREYATQLLKVQCPNLSEEDFMTDACKDPAKVKKQQLDARLKRALEKAFAAGRMSRQQEEWKTKGGKGGKPKSSKK